MPDSALTSYVEPFFGGGAIGLNLLRDAPKLTRVWFNDADTALIDLWIQVRTNPDQLIDRVLSYTPSVDSFFEAKTKTDGFSKLVVHQLSFGGLGAVARGPIGGKSQAGTGKITDRWRPKTLVKKIAEIHKLMARVDLKLTAMDYRQVLSQLNPDDFIYLDPPYFGSPEATYVHDFGPSDHQILADTLTKIDNNWLLSYKDYPEIRDLYRGCAITEVDLCHSLTVRKQVCEILIRPTPIGT